jgi:hypothetical protein
MNALLHRDVGDVNRPDLVDLSYDQLEIDEAGEALGWITRNRGARLLVDRPYPHAEHEVSHPVAADRDPFLRQVAHHPAAAAAGIFQVISIDPGHDPQR